MGISCVSDPVEDEAQAEEEEAGVMGRAGPLGRLRAHATGDLHLGDDQGRQRRRGLPSGAVRVDKRFDLTLLHIAGLNLGEDDGP